MPKTTAILLAAIAIAHLGYFAFPEPLQARAFYVLRGVEGMGLFGLLLRYGFHTGLWAAACMWGFMEEWQTSVCRIATFDQPPGGDSMICVGLLGVKPYAVILAASLAFMALGAIKPWPRT